MAETTLNNGMECVPWVLGTQGRHGSVSTVETTATFSLLGHNCGSSHCLASRETRPFHLGDAFTGGEHRLSGAQLWTQGQVKRDASAVTAWRADGRELGAHRRGLGSSL